MIVKFSNIGKSIGTRSLGKKVRNQVVTEIEKGNKVIFDFEGVDLISHSFSDECFGKLLNNWELDFIKSKTTFKNLNTEIESTVLFTINERLSQLELA